MSNVCQRWQERTWCQQPAFLSFLSIGKTHLPTFSPNLGLCDLWFLWYWVWLGISQLGRKWVGVGGVWLVQTTVLVSCLYPRLSRLGAALLYLEIVIVFCAVLQPENMLLQYPSPLKVFTWTPPSPWSLPWWHIWNGEHLFPQPHAPLRCLAYFSTWLWSPWHCVYQTFSFVTVSSIRISAPG